MWSWGLCSLVPFTFRISNKRAPDLTMHTSCCCCCCVTQVFAGLRFHPGVNLLHSAAQHVATKLQQATAASSSYRLGASSITILLQVGGGVGAQRVWQTWNGSSGALRYMTGSVKGGGDLGPEGTVW